MEQSAAYAASSSIASPRGISYSVPCHRNFFACRRRRTRCKLSIQSSFRAPKRFPVADASASDDSEVPPSAELEDEEDPVLPTVSTTFLLEKRCEYGERFVVAGDHEFLGAWDPSSAIAMTWSEGHVWKCEVDLPVGKLYEFKFVLTSKEAEPHWQPGPNRTFTTSEAPVIVSESWEPEEVGADEGSTQFRSESPDDVPTTGLDVDGAELGGEQNLEAAMHSEVSQAVADVTTQVEENVPATEVENSEENEPAIASTESVTPAELAIISTVPDLISEEEPEEEESNGPPEAAASVPSKQTISADTSSTVQDTAPAETSESSVQGVTSSPKEDSKGFKSFKFDTPDRSASPTENTSKNGQSVTKEATEVPFLEAALASTVLSDDEELT